MTLQMYCEILKKGDAHGVIQNKSRGMLTYGVVFLCYVQCAFACSFSHASSAGAFKLGVVCPPSLQLRSRSEQLPPYQSYQPEELVEITAFQK
jgi:hypothetical protein